MNHTSTSWNPHDLFRCLDSEPLAWLNIVLCLGVVFWYVVITFTTWLPAMKGASHFARRSMLWMAVIFIFCSLAGYATFAASGSYPKTAIILRTIFLALQNIACPVFLISKINHDFRAIGRSERIGSHFIAIDLSKMSNAEVVSLATRATAAGLERLEQKEI